MDRQEMDRLLAMMEGIRGALDRIAAELEAIRLHQEGLAVKPYERKMGEG